MSELWAYYSDGPYEVSTRGRVRRLGRVLLQHANNCGYMRVKLSRNGEGRDEFVHHLVAACFIGPRPDGCEVNHLDGNKKNNAVENLEYCTPAENVAHSVRLGLNPCGERQGSSRFTEKDVRLIRKRAAEGQSQASLARLYSVHHSAIWKIVAGVNWSHLAKGETDAD